MTLFTYLTKRLGHIIRSINTNIAAFKTHIEGGYSFIYSEWPMKVIHIIFIYFSDMMPMDATTPKLTEQGEIAQKVRTNPYGESHLKCADAGRNLTNWIPLN
jgi:hypothetical protein